MKKAHALDFRIGSVEHQIDTCTAFKIQICYAQVAKGEISAKERRERLCWRSQPCIRPIKTIHVVMPLRKALQQGNRREHVANNTVLFLEEKTGNKNGWKPETFQQLVCAVCCFLVVLEFWVVWDLVPLQLSGSVTLALLSCCGIWQKSMIGSPHNDRHN